MGRGTRALLLRIGAAVMAAWALIAPAAGAVAAPDDVPRPNIIVLLVDDLPALDGRWWPHLEQIERTFASGLELTDFHVEASLCCPGRAGYLTGQHVTNHGVVQNDARLFRPSMTVATQLRASGYHTVHAGKYFNLWSLMSHLGKPAGWDRFHAMLGSYYDYNLWSNGLTKRFGSAPADYSTDVIGRAFVHELRTAPPDRPFFGWLSVYAPHIPLVAAQRHQGDPRCADIDPWRPPNYNEEDVSDKPAYVRSKPLLAADAWDLTTECEMLLAVDDLVASIREELVRSGRLEDTLFILTSDNGMNHGAHRLAQKSTPYATHVPFFASWPGQLDQGPRRVSDRLHNIDLAPTLCALAGCTMGPYPNGQATADGESFADLLLGGRATPVRDALLTALPQETYVPGWYAVSTTRHSPLAAVGCHAAGWNGCRWHYIENVGDVPELYDVSGGPCWEWEAGLPGDPCRLQNRAGDPGLAEIEDALRMRLDELKVERGR